MPRADPPDRRPSARRFAHPHAVGAPGTTVAYAKWVHTCDDEPDHPGQTLATRNHEVIRRWAAQRRAVPATEKSTPGTAGTPPLLRFDFWQDAESADGRLVHIDWNDWLEAFDDGSLVFLYQETLANGRQSDFFRLDSPDSW